MFFTLNLILSNMSHSLNKCIDCNAELLGGILRATANILQPTYLCDCNCSF